MVLLVVLAAAAASDPSALLAQPPVLRRARIAPNDDYLRGFPLFFEGDYESAAEVFRLAASGGVRSTEGRWIDSICYHAMIGQCYYQMGNLVRALDQFESAIRLYLAYPHWLLQIDFPETIGPSSHLAGQPYVWGVSKRSMLAGQIPDHMSCLMGRIDNEAVIRRGGVVAPAELYSVRVSEIVRCTALAIRRRREIMGPACPHSELTSQLVQALSSRPARPNHWSQRWVEAQLGLACAAAGKLPQAIEELEKSLCAAGQLNHQLTAIALLELGQLAFEQGEYQRAASYFFETTFAAALFSQYDVMDEGFQKGMITHLVSGQKGLYPLLGPAAAWARRRAPALEVSLLISAAENQAAMGQTAPAKLLLEQARWATQRKQMRAGAVGARLQYQTALVRFQEGDVSAGAKILASVMSYQQNSSRRLFQIALVDRLYSSGKGRLSDRVANLLFEDVLREPAAKDWLHDPMETLAVATSPLATPMAHWFEVAWKRKDEDRALEIADCIRRKRFFSTLPMGGRLLALRWVLEAPEEALSQIAVLQRRDLLARYPQYSQLSRKSAAVRESLERAAIAPADEKSAKQQAQQLAELAKLSAAQETLLCDLALRREPSEFAFPPILDIKTLRQGLPQRRLIMAFLTAGQQTFRFLLSKDKYELRALATPQQLRGDVVAMLRAIGNYERNQPVNPDQLKDESWKALARKLFERLAVDVSAKTWEEFDELVVVPDGVLWYVPFEALQVAGGDSTEPLISKVALRCAPTVSLTAPDRRGYRPAAETAVVVGRLFARDDEATAEAAFAELKKALPGASRLPSPLPAPSGTFAVICPRLVVLSEIDDADRGPYEWSPIPIDRGRPGSSLASWLPLPWGGPEQVLLPGFHSAAENSLKRGGSGDELFLASCGLMACGARTLLLSRWRTGGQTSYDLIREFAQELPHTSAAEAWRRSIQLARSSELDSEKEPRVEKFTADGGLKAEHPFFWSGYLLVDTGATPQHESPAPAPAPLPEVKAPPAGKP